MSLTKGLLEAGVDVTVATTDADGSGRLPVPTGELTEWRSIPVRFFSRYLGESFKYSPALARWLNRSVREFDIIHIHAIFSHSSISAAAACRRWRVPYILRPLGSLDPAPLERHALRKSIFHALWGKTMLRDSVAIQYGTSREMSLVESRFAPGGGFVAPQGVEIPPIEDERKRGAGSAECTFSSPYVLFLGRIDPIKRLETLIDAFIAATNEGGLKHWQLAIGGEGNPGYMDGLRRRARAIDKDDRVKFHGWLSGAAKLEALSGASLFALTSSHENFGRAAAEAMLAGVPVIVSEDVFLADQIRSSGAGWVAGREPGELVRILREAMSNAECRVSKGVAAKELATSRFGIRDTTHTIVERYRSIVGSRCGDPGN